MDPKNDVEEAIVIFHKALLEYAMGHIVNALEKHKRKIKLKEPLSFVVSGGTTMPKGFLHLLVEVLKENPLPIPVGKVWQAKNAVMAVAKGCLISAQRSLETAPTTVDPEQQSVDISDGKNELHAYPKPKKMKAPEKKTKTLADKQTDEKKEKIIQEIQGGGFAEAIDLSEA